jgi:hypothetical protein
VPLQPAPASHPRVRQSGSRHQAAVIASIDLSDLTSYMVPAGSLEDDRPVSHQVLVSSGHFLVAELHADPTVPGIVVRASSELHETTLEVLVSEASWAEAGYGGPLSALMPEERQRLFAAICEGIRMVEAEGGRRLEVHLGTAKLATEQPPECAHEAGTDLGASPPDGAGGLSTDLNHPNDGTARTCFHL